MAATSMVEEMGSLRGNGWWGALPIDLFSLFSYFDTVDVKGIV